MTEIKELNREQVQHFDATMNLLLPRRYVKIARQFVYQTIHIYLMLGRSDEFRYCGVL